MKNFKIIIQNLIGGLAKYYWKSGYPSAGDITQAGMMRNIDISNPSGIKPSPGRNMTFGLAGLVRSIVSTPISTGKTYAVGGAYLYEFVGNAMTVDATYPYLIAGVNIDAEDIKPVHFRLSSVDYTGLIFSLNESHQGNVGSVINGSIDPDWAKNWVSWAVSTISFSTGLPHPIEVVDDGLTYVANGNQIVSFDTIDPPSGSAVGAEALLLPYGFVINGMKLYRNKLFITGNQPDINSTTSSKHRLFIYDLVSESYDSEYQQIAKGGGIYLKDDTIFIFYEDISDLGTGILGYWDGAQIKKILSWRGSVPEYYQIGQRDGALIWVSNVDGEDLIFAYKDGKLSQFTKGYYSTIGGIGTPFGSLLMGTANGTTNYAISFEDGYESDAYWRSLMQDITLGGRSAMVRKVKANFEPVENSAGAVVKLIDQRGTELWRGTISYPTDSGKVCKTWHLNKKTPNVAVEVDYTDFTATSTIVLFKSIEIKGNNIA